MAGCCLGSGSPPGTLGTVRGCTPGTVFNNSPIRDTSEYSPPGGWDPRDLQFGGIWGYPLLVRDLNTDFGPKPSILEVSPGGRGGTEIRTPGPPEQIRPPGPRDPQGAPGSSGGPSKSTSLGYTQGPANRSISSGFGALAPQNHSDCGKTTRGGQADPLSAMLVQYTTLGASGISPPKRRRPLAWCMPRTWSPSLTLIVLSLTLIVLA